MRTTDTNSSTGSLESRTPSPETHQVRDGNRTIRFHGHLLSQASSQRPHAPRYVSLSLYRIASPSPPFFVFTRVGHSTVFHSSDCLQATRNRLPFGHELPTPIPDLEALTPCPYCAPRSTELTTHRFETTRYFATICPTPEALLATLQHSPKNSLQSPGQLPWLSQELLDLALPHDQILNDFFSEDLTRG